MHAFQDLQYSSGTMCTCQMQRTSLNARFSPAVNTFCAGSKQVVNGVLNSVAMTMPDVQGQTAMEGLVSKLENKYGGTSKGKKKPKR
jgi:hypothetical protein